MKKICKSIVLALVLLCLALAPIAALGGSLISAKSNASYENVLTSNSNLNSAATDSGAKIYLEAKNEDSNGVAQPEKNNGWKIGFYIKATSSVSNLVVHWRTRDRSAIAALGDYAAKDTTYTLNGTTSSLIYIVVYNNGVSTRVDTKIFGFGNGINTTPDDTVSRDFYIEITDIDCHEDVATVDKTRRQLVASAGSENTISVTKIIDSGNANNFMLYFSVYNWANTWRGLSWSKGTSMDVKRRTAIWVDKSPNIRDGHKEYTPASDPAQGNFLRLLRLGYADLYATIKADTYEDKYFGGSDNIRVSIVYADNKEYICQYDIEYKGWSSEHTYDMLQMQTSSRYTTNPGKVILGETIFTHYNGGKYYYVYREEWWEVKDYERKIQIEFWDYEDYEDRYFYDARVLTMIADTKAPVVKDYYLQQQSIKQGDKLGLSVRFSEPVQVIDPNKAPYITARINNSSTNTATFEYVSGSGTDTLYFEWTPEEKRLDISSFTFDTFGNASSISDYSLTTNVVTNPQIFESDDTDSFRGNSKFTYYDPVDPISGETMSEAFKKHNQLAKPSVNKTVNYSIDLRRPDTYTDVTPGEVPNKYFEVPIILKDLKQNGTLYYTWTTSTLYPENYDNEVTNLGEIYTIRASNMNGKYYLHIKAKSAYGREQIYNVGPFKFDDSPPTIETNVSGNLNERTFDITTSDGGVDSDWVAGIEKLVMIVASDKECKNVVKTYSYNGEAAREFKKKITVSAVDLGVGENDFATFYVRISAYDALGNKTQSDVTSYKFDTRTFIDAKFDEVYFDSRNRVLQPSGEDFKIIDMSGMKSYENINLIFTTSDTTGAQVDWIVKNSKGETFPCSGSSGTSSQQISFASDFASGYYTIVITATESGTTKYSQEMVFYFTRSMQEDNLEYYDKINKGLLLANDVFQMQSDLPYYYMDADGNIQSEKYGNTSKPATFSSKYEAIKYLKFMEYRDLYPVKIDATQADLLNGRSSPNFLKATGETAVAQAGQIWIRYKTTSFDKDPTTSQWVYYYYQGDTLTIRQELLSMNLVSSIGTIAERLAKNYGSNIVLVGQGNTNKYNEPYLEKEQIHFDYESSSQTKCGISYGKAMFYDGDTKIYNSTITEGGVAYSIVTNMELYPKEYSRLFYKSKSNSTYTEIDFTKYTNMSQVITSSGVYDLVELGSSGARKFSVYVDKDAPILTGFMEDVDGNTITKEFSRSSQGITYTAKSFSFGQFLDIEKDEYAYVSVWKYLTNKTGELLNVYLRSALQTNSYVLDNGDYHVEVFDRSGNGFSFIIRVNAQSFACDTIIKENEYVIVNCNRDEDKIQSYEIYLNGELLTSKYSQRVKLEQSGVYSIYILDIFGNEYRKEFEFKRIYPTVTWQYYDKSLDGYVTYDDNARRMKLVPEGEATFRIITSSLLQFRYDSLFKYQFVGNVDFSENSISHVVKINSLQGFVLKVSYAEYIEGTVTYICEVDDTAPSISVANEIETYYFNELKDFENQLETGNVGDELKYKTISYSKKSIVTSYLTSGDTVQSRILKVSAMDNYGLSLLRVYLDNSLLIEETENFSNIVLSRFGSYRIEAFDTFDNKSEFVFVNATVENLKYFVDQIEKDCSGSTLKYFDNDDNFSKIDYGKESVRLNFNGNGSLNLKITANKPAELLLDKTMYLSLEIKDGKIYFLTSKIDADDGYKVMSIVRSTAIFDISQKDTVAGKWYVIANKNQCGSKISAMFDADGNMCLMLEGDEDGCVVEGRADVGHAEPFYFKVELSSAKSDVVVKLSNGSIVRTNQDEVQIKISEPFCIARESEFEKIEFVRVYHSENGRFKDYTLAYDAGTFHDNNFSADGLYLVEIKNVYGNVTQYYILKSKDFMVTVSSVLSDGKTFDYSSKFDGKIFGNNVVYINAYSENITCYVTKNNMELDVVKEVKKGVSIVKLSGDGVYFVRITDEFGNVFEKSIEIKFESLPFDENLIDGYNEGATAQDENNFGYTNTTLSISKDKVQEKDLRYASIVFGDVEVAVLDLISEQKINLSEEKLSHCIGLEGDGKYVVVFRDKFGNKMAEKTIYFKKDTTLHLSRTTRSSSETFECDVQDAIRDGFWANNSLIFNTSAQNYTLKIGNEKQSCPYTLHFGSGAEEGSIDYQIFYQDEYGNSHTFVAHLFRQKLNITPSSVTKTVEENGILVTKNNIVLAVPANATCTYLFDGKEYAYAANQELKRDGSYLFVAKDLAGNTTTLTIKKDTVVEFEMTEVSTGTKVINGGVVCSDKVSFKALGGDSAYVKYVFKDGNLIADFDDNKFVGSGKWEVIVSDKVGNERYFAFQIITHKLKDFAYFAPNEYSISEVWFDAGDGVSLSCKDNVVSDEGGKISLVDNGKYLVVMTSKITGQTSSFSITINNSKPQIKLVGCNENETTLNDVTISGYKVGDKIEIYRDKKLYKTIEILTSQTDAPIITEGGNYVIVVTNEAGVQTTVSFAKKYIPNAPGNVLIIVLIVLAALVVFIGLVYRQRSKVDE